MRPQATFSFFIFLQLFHFFTFLVAPSSSSLLPPRPSFLLVPPSSLFLFLPLPVLSRSLRIPKRPFFIGFDESVTDRPTDQPTDGQGLLQRCEDVSKKKSVMYGAHFFFLKLFLLLLLFSVFFLFASSFPLFHWFRVVDPKEKVSYRARENFRPSVQTNERTSGNQANFFKRRLLLVSVLCARICEKLSLLGPLLCCHYATFI